ncbi:SLC13 family permease [Chelativorans salis]|uniref:SLC13 family permease n=1 Tax=Chelativorans salis TaxID=2978478 RepID=A0ABT2LM75_9HYPH|nr:SLC13 family permease [Chelativorans sp. EGI FJ00035]MCT7375542.1 SLC13 family permease [Chelativorans sp. EGI FJ00035]
MTEALGGTFHIWATYVLVVVAIAGFAWERIQVEVVSLLVLVALLLLFELFPLADADGENPLDSRRLLAGFANPALIAVLALLVLGNGLWRSGALDWALRRFLQRVGKRRHLAFGICFATVFVASPFVNNTPVVVIFIPILETIVRNFSMPPSRVMIPLSFTAILAGMTTLIGSSTNLLVSGALSQLGEEPLGFFDFTVPGLVLASVGLTYVVLVVPRLLRPRHSPMQRHLTGKNRRFITQLTVGKESKLIGKIARFDLLGIRGSRLLLVQRGEYGHVSPFGNLKLREDDVLVVMATYDALAEAQTKFPRLMFSASGTQDLPANEGEREARLSRGQIVAEVMITPGSRLAGYSLDEVGFRAHYNCLVLGVERQSRVIRRRLTDTVLREGDVLVIQGDQEALDRMREHRGVVVLDGTTQPLPAARTAKKAGAIFAGTVLVAAVGILPIAAAAVAGVALMLTTGVLTLNQATSALDRRIFLMVGASLALGAAMLETGAAAYLAQGVIGLAGGAGSAVVLSALFLLVALLTNVLSNNATAILFTPIALGLASGLDSDPMPFALAVLFGANCSFATPVAYQTNLLVMGPGYYRFTDFLRTGGPLVALLWIAFSLFVPWYYGLLN